MKERDLAEQMLRDQCSQREHLSRCSSIAFIQRYAPA